MKYLTQAISYAAFAAIVGLLSVWPRFELLPADQAIVSLTFSHAGERIGECRKLTQEELNELPPNMRKPTDCPRERHPIRLEFHVDETLAYSATLPPSGLWSDGKATVYHRLQIDAGTRTLSIAMNDSGGNDDFDYESSVVREISPGQNLVIGFDESHSKFIFR